jgi:hypothetical protein
LSSTLVPVAWLRISSILSPTVTTR